MRATISSSMLQGEADDWWTTIVSTRGVHEGPDRVQDPLQNEVLSSYRDESQEKRVHFPETVSE
ncbi:hypothetical protein Sjap_012707 [Stephania japonica]|uniref:Uncharacterized protein n=1 Tax=Stephania japonica TaxID=461633 RepID=A0AAP0IXQ8_9MAGN